MLATQWGLSKHWLKEERGEKEGREGEFLFGAQALFVKQRPVFLNFSFSAQPQGESIICLWFCPFLHSFSNAVFANIQSCGLRALRSLRPESFLLVFLLGGSQKTTALFYVGWGRGSNWQRPTEGVSAGRESCPFLPNAWPWNFTISPLWQMQSEEVGARKVCHQPSFERDACPRGAGPTLLFSSSSLTSLPSSRLTGELGSH